MARYLDINGDDSYLRTTKMADVNRLISKLRKTFNQVNEADTADAYVIYKGERHRLHPVQNYGALRHALSNWDYILTLLDDTAEKDRWSDKYKSDVYRRVKDLVDQEVIGMITGWFSTVCLKELAEDKEKYAHQRKGYDKIVSKAGVVGRELKAAKRDRQMLMHHLLLGDYDKATRVARAIEKRLNRNETPTT